MATGKRYYWMKLKESFMTSETIDFFMTQPDGANYVVLYQMLCLKTINTGGRLSRQIGEIIIPYDAEKIQRDAKWFSIDTVRVALDLYRRLGLIYEDVDGTLVLADHENLVGSDTDWADKKRRQRLGGGDNVPVLSPPMSPDCPPDVPKNVPIDIDIRDRDKDIRDKEKEIEGVGGRFAPCDAPVPEASPPAPDPRHKYGEYGWVRLTDKEYQKLLDDLGQAELDRCITYIDESAQSNGNKNKWKDWNLVIRKCSKQQWGVRQGAKKPFKYDYGSSEGSL